MFFWLGNFFCYLLSGYLLRPCKIKWLYDSKTHIKNIFLEIKRLINQSTFGSLMRRISLPLLTPIWVVLSWIYWLVYWMGRTRQRSCVCFLCWSGLCDLPTPLSVLLIWWSQLIFRTSKNIWEALRPPRKTKVWRNTWVKDEMEQKRKLIAF